MKRSSHQRSGVSLAEVLIAIFVMAIGILGILSLFPLAAINMAQAIKDENTAQLNQSATASLRWIWKDEISLHPGGLYPDPPPAPPITLDYFDPLFNAMSNPNFPFNPDVGAAGQIPYTTAGSPPPIPPTWAGPSYPVFVDPVGWNNSLNALQPQQFWVAGIVGGIPRRSMRRIEWGPYVAGTGYINPMPPAVKPILINRTCFRLDDFGFGKDGTPYNSSTDPLQTSGVLGAAAMVGEIQRDGRYSCAFMLKRPANNISMEADLTVVVYNARSLTNLSEETAYQTLFTQNSTEAILYYSGTAPKIRRGQWILDASMTRPNGTVQSPESHGYFYRVINVNSDTPGQLTLELQTPAHWWPDAGASPNTMSNTGTVYGVGVIMDGVVEVFERGTLTQFTMPVP